MKPQIHDTSARETRFQGFHVFGQQFARPVILTMGVVCTWLLTGCGPTGSAVKHAKPRSKSGPAGHVTNRDGHVTGVIPEINVKFDVLDVKTGGAGSSHTVEAGSKAGGAQSMHTRWEITAGEVEIEFERSDDGPVSLAVDGEDFGTINEGDVLLIDAQRQVLINARRRESRGAIND